MRIRTRWSNGRGISPVAAERDRCQRRLLRDGCVHLNRHYLKSMTTGVPYIAIRAGMSLDGKLSDKSHRSRWVTSSELRRYSHSLRGEFSAILAGTETGLADNPRLTLRDPHWKGKRFFRVVLDTRNRLPRHLLVFRDQDRFPTIVFSSIKAADRTPKTDHHFFLPPGAKGLSLPDVCRVLFRQGITSVLVEGGGKVIDSFLASGLFDEVALFVSPTIIGRRRIDGSLRFRRGQTGKRPASDGYGDHPLDVGHDHQGVQTMFTGIVLKTATVFAWEKKTPPVLSIRLESDEAVKIGDSLAVNGVCLTVIGVKRGCLPLPSFRGDFETDPCRRSFPGAAVNVEFPLRAGDFLSGHLVSGHVDGTVRVRSIRKNPAAIRFSFTYQNPEWRKFLVPKGSVALNGISLTLSEVAPSWFAVDIIPHTLEQTNLRFLKIGERVNVELDLIGKYLYNFHR